MTLALYRTYRPGRFGDVVGQEHVTGPLQRALANDRVHHAYLFSGPRGCGKTSSARILARSLNCATGPTAEPCGQCRSCVELAPNGPGSMDVVEMDAATHRGIDDARELRERAHYAPASSPYKVYIIDEAHQLTPEAGNALLKIVEEPPPHLKFVFATTAPDKILQTIRSRAHHYPFRLVPSRTLQRHLAWICEQEGVGYDPVALGLVTRVGAGSVRDALSVLGQLMAGAGPEGLTYELAVGLLGFTDGALLDEVVDAVAARDGGTMFGAVDRVMDSGHDPRRFLTDVLERLRDLVVLRAVPDAVAQGLIDAPEDLAERMGLQAQRFGAHDLVRLADVVDGGITAMKGATPTRLQLELVVARLLLPGADDSVAGVQARLDRLERRIAMGGFAPAAAAAETPAQPAGTPREPDPAREPDLTRQPDLAREPDLASGPVGQAPEPVATARQAPEPVAAPAHQVPGPPADATAEPGGPQVADVRRMWAEVLEAVASRRRFTWTLVRDNAQVVGLAQRRLTLGFVNAGARDRFVSSGSDEVLRQALIDVMALDVGVDAVVDPSAGGGARAVADLPGSAGQPAPARPPRTARAAEPTPTTSPPTAPAAPVAGAAQPTADPRPRAAGADGDVDPDDDDLDDPSSQQELLARTLGATVIEEIEHP